MASGLQHLRDMTPIYASRLRFSAAVLASLALSVAGCGDASVGTTGLWHGGSAPEPGSSTSPGSGSSGGSSGSQGSGGNGASPGSGTGSGSGSNTGGDQGSGAGNDAGGGGGS